MKERRKKIQQLNQLENNYKNALNKLQNESENSQELINNLDKAYKSYNDFKN